MRKLKLDLDDLLVTSFQTDGEMAVRNGTVDAHGLIPVPETQQYSCGETYCGNCPVDLSARTLCGIPLTAYACTAHCGVE